MSKRRSAPNLRGTGIDRAGKLASTRRWRSAPMPPPGDARFRERTGPFLVALDERGGRVSTEEAKAIGERFKLSPRAVTGLTRTRWPVLASDGPDRVLTDRGCSLANEWRRRYTAE